LENAAKYTPPGSPLEISARAMPGNATVELRLVDHGPGLPPGDEERVFTKFYRAAGGITAGAPGAGLGLAICRGIAEAHGGGIRAERHNGQGAAFVITIPTGGSPPPLPSGDIEGLGGPPGALEAA
jgi:two-component system sensor histidine kinase KdpD